MLAPAFAITLVIHLANLAGAPPHVVRDARLMTEDILGDIGVTVEWIAPSDYARGAANVIRLTILPHEGGALRARAAVVMGSATRTTLGTGVAWVYYQRVLEEAEHHDVSPARLLACAMAHEIGHLVLASPGHEPAGLMRALWSAADFRRAAMGQLRFTVEGRRPAFAVRLRESQE